ncbi:MAG: CDP-alcohol phosphatidyltransferase family protein [Candidatus Bathyarchaeia archaeon]
MQTRVRAKVQGWIIAEAKLMHRAGLKPNMVSVMGVIFGILSGLAYWAAGSSTNIEIYRIYLLLAVLLISLSGFCDALDGALARLYGEITAFGGFLDSLLDRYVDAAVICGLILGGLCEIPWGLLALLGSLLTSYARARSEAADVPMESIGLIERAERLLIIILASIMGIILPEVQPLNVGIILLALASNLTVAQRTFHFYKKTRSKK